MSDALIAFLRARLDESDRLIRGSGDLGWLTFRQPDGSMDHTEAACFSGGVWIVAGKERTGYASAVVVSRESERLAEVEAKRRTLDRYEDALARQTDPDYSARTADVQVAEYEDWIIPALALPYADHPDYREEWRP